MGEGEHLRLNGGQVTLGVGHGLLHVFDRTKIVIGAFCKELGQLFCLGEGVRAVVQSVGHDLDDKAENCLDGDDIEEADTTARIAAYTFPIPREQYLEWMEAIKQQVGFEKKEIIAELKRRLGL